MWHGENQLQIIKYKSSQNLRKFTVPISPEDVVDPYVNRFIEKFHETGDRIGIITALNQTISKFNQTILNLTQTVSKFNEKLLIYNQTVSELSKFKEFLEQMTSD